MAELAHITAVVTATTSQFQSAMAQVNSTVTATASRMGALSASTAAASASMSKVGRAVTKGVTLPVVAAGAAGVAMSVDFESSMAKIEGLVGVAKDDVKAMGAQARKLGPQYGKSASEAGEALFFITSAGLRGKDAMEVLEQSLKASAIGLGDTATIADLATSAMNAYGSEVLPAAKSTDVMIAAVREGKLEASELAGAMGQTLPIASNMGVSFDQVGAAFAAMSRTGTGASQAATQLRGILSALKKPTKQANDTLAAYGMSAQGLRDKIRKDGLLPVLKQLTGAFGDNEEAQAMVFGNVRALTGVMDLMGANVGTTEKIFKSLTKTLGATDKAMAVTAETTGFKMAVAWASIKQTLMQFGDALLPVVNSVMSALSAVGRAFGSLPGPIKTAVIGVIGFVAAIGPLMWMGGKVGGSLSRLATGMATTTAATTVATGKVSGLARALPLLSRAGPAGAAIGGLIGIGAALMMMRPQFTGMARVQKEVAEATNAATSAASDQEASFKSNNEALKANGTTATALKDAKKKVSEAEDALRTALSNSKTPTAELAELTRELTEARVDEARQTSNAAQAQATTVSAVANLITKEDEATRALKEKRDSMKDAYIASHQYGASVEEQAVAEAKFLAADAEYQQRLMETPDRLNRIRDGIKRQITQLEKSGNKSDATASALESLSTILGVVDDRSRNLKDIKIDAKGNARKVLGETKTKALSLDGKTFSFTVDVFGKQKGDKIPGGYKGGFVSFFAGGGMVRGPSGKDVIPAMLTAGEVVLTKRQQSLVDGGMSIRDAIMSTGGAYAKGGLVQRRAGAAKRVKSAKAALAAAKKGGNETSIKNAEKALKNAQDSLKRINDAIKNREQVMQPAFQSVVDNITTNTLAQFDDETSRLLSNLANESRVNMDEISRTFSGGVTKINGQWVRVTGTIEQAQANTDRALKAIEARYAETFKGIDTDLADAQTAINARFDALTPAEARINEMEDAAAQMSLDKGISDAQSAIAAANAELAKAQKWGDVEGMKAAQEQLMAARQQLADAEREQTLANLRKTAEQERAEAEANRNEALTREQTFYDDKRQNQTDAMNAELEAERQKGETSRMILEAQMAEKQAIEADNLATKQASLEEERRMQRSTLEDNLQDFGENFMKLRRMFLGNHRTITNQVKLFARSLKRSGAAAAVAFAAGISDGFGAVQGASDRLAAIVAQYLQLSSPSEKGPLSTLDHWFDAFDSTLLSGMDKRSIEDAIGIGTTRGRSGAGGGGSTTVNLTITDQTFAGMSREQADRVARQVQAALDRRVSFRV